MDGSSYATIRRRIFSNPKAEVHPHQMWLKADRKDSTANFAAFRAADAGLRDSTMEKVLGLHDSAQYHFIQTLLWHDGEGNHCCTVAQALCLARKHHKEVKQ